MVEIKDRAACLVHLHGMAARYGLPDLEHDEQILLLWHAATLQASIAGSCFVPGPGPAAPIRYKLALFSLHYAILANDDRLGLPADPHHPEDWQTLDRFRAWLGQMGTDKGVVEPTAMNAASLAATIAKTTAALFIGEPLPPDAGDDVAELERQRLARYLGVVMNLTGALMAESLADAEIQAAGQVHIIMAGPGGLGGAS